MSVQKKQMLDTLKQLKVQINKLAKLQIEDASRQIDAYLKVVEAEQKRRGK